MEWIKTNVRYPIPEIDGVRVETFSPAYSKDVNMRHRIMDSQFVRICKEITHWRKLDEPDLEDNKCKNCGSKNLIKEFIFRCKDCNCFHDKNKMQI